MTASEYSWPELLEMLLEGQNLTGEMAEKLMQAWLDEELAPEQTGAFLAALRAKSLTGEELASMALVLRNACSLPCEVPDFPMVDTCGTGGDGAETFNISTAVAFVSAACGARVAKHGNRSASGKVGSADVLEALGINLKAPLPKVVNAINTSNITFLFAPAWHPSLVNLAPIRKKIGVRTVFNLLGPLVNPLRPSSQVLGVAKQDLLEPIANALKLLGLERAVVVHGAGGLDEGSLQGDNDLIFLDNGKLRREYLSPSSLGLSLASIEAIKGGDLAENKEILSAVLQGKGTRAQMEVVALNTSLVLWSSGVKDDLKEGVSTALKCLNEGIAWDLMLRLREDLNSSNS